MSNTTITFLPGDPDKLNIKKAVKEGDKITFKLSPPEGETPSSAMNDLSTQLFRTNRSVTISANDKEGMLTVVFNKAAHNVEAIANALKAVGVANADSPDMQQLLSNNKWQRLTGEQTGKLMR